MFVEESIWIRNVIDGIEPPRDVLEVGSSTLEFRTVTQPYIEANVHKPLRERNTRIYCLDRKGGKGVDYITDVETARFEDINRTFDLIICCSLLEHLRQPHKAADLITRLVKPQGHLIASVPRDYRHHEDPIDTMLRPTPEELAAIFPDLETVKKETVKIADRRHYSLRNPLELARYSIPPLHWKVSCLLMKKMQLP